MKKVGVEICVGNFHTVLSPVTGGCRVALKGKVISCTSKLTEILTKVVGLWWGALMSLAI